MTDRLELKKSQFSPTALAIPSPKPIVEYRKDITAASTDRNHSSPNSGIWDRIICTKPNILMYGMFEAWHGPLVPLWWKQSDLVIALNPKRRKFTLNTVIFPVEHMYQPWKWMDFHWLHVVFRMKLNLQQNVPFPEEWYDILSKKCAQHEFKLVEWVSNFVWTYLNIFRCDSWGWSLVKLTMTRAIKRQISWQLRLKSKRVICRTPCLMLQ